MAEWCFFYKRPVSEFWDLTSSEHEYMIAYARQFVKPIGL